MPMQIIGVVITVAVHVAIFLFFSTLINFFKSQCQIKKVGAPKTRSMNKTILLPLTIVDISISVIMFSFAGNVEGYGMDEAIANLSP